MEAPDRASLLSAYRAGREDERAERATAPADTADKRRDAYERGRRDERARRRGSPLLTLLVVLIAAAGGALVYLAAREGSFGRGGQVVDHTLSHAADQAKPAVGRAGEAMENAGRSLKQTSGSNQS
jgi:hypothetical protein